MRPFQVYVDRAAMAAGHAPIIVRDTRNGSVTHCKRAHLDDAVILLAAEPNDDGALVYIQAADVTVEGDPCQPLPPCSRSSGD